MFSFIKKKLGWGTTPAEPSPQEPSPEAAQVETPATHTLPAPHTPEPASAAVASPPPMPSPDIVPTAEEPVVERRSWLDKLRQGLRKTGSSIAQVFTGTQIDDALYEELEAALLMADAGVSATEFLLQDLKRRVKDAKATDPAQVKGLLIDAIT